MAEAEGVSAAVLSKPSWPAVLSKKLLWHQEAAVIQGRIEANHL